MKPLSFETIQTLTPPTNSMVSISKCFLQKGGKQRSTKTSPRCGVSCLTSIGLVFVQKESIGFGLSIIIPTHTKKCKYVSIGMCHWTVGSGAR
jgi:hypothetical protein